MEDKKLIKLSNDSIKEMTCSEVYEQFKNFLYKMAIKWSRQYEVEDIFQIAGIGLTNAYKRYSADKDIKFMTYLYMAVKNEILKYHSKNEKHAGIKSLDCPIGEDTITLIDMLADETNYEEIAVENINKAEISNLVESLIKCLNQREKMIVKYRFTDGLSLRKIGEKFNISGARVDVIVDSSLRKMKNYYITKNERKVSK